MHTEDLQKLETFLEGNGGAVESVERRQHTRKPFRLSVKMIHDRVADHKKARDISLSGIFLEKVDNIAPGEELHLSLPFSNQDGYIKIKGKVVRVTRDGIGVHFDILSIDIEQK